MGRPKLAPNYCKEEGCQGIVYGFGHCNKHYYQMKRYGKILERTRFDPNEIIIKQRHAEVILYDKKNQEKARTKIDKEDVESVKNLKWKMNSDGYAYCTAAKMMMHRLIINTPRALETDHINHNTLDNRKKNLRIVTRSQNNMNKGQQVGVCRASNGTSWRAHIKINGKQTSRQVKTYREAVVQRIAWEEQYFGEYAPKR